MFLAEILNYSSWQNSASVWLTALAVFILTFIILKIFCKQGIKKIKSITKHTKTKLDDLVVKIIKSISWFFYFILSLYLAFQIIQAPLLVKRIIYYLLIISITYYVIKVIQSFIDFSAQKVILKRKAQDEKFEPSIIKLLAKTLKIILWLIAIIIILQNLGYKISALVAGLGVGGVAIAFALQNVLTDIFASFSIYFDKPFQTGDYIVVGEDSGTVKKIGLKSTRIQTLQGEELIISNKELTEQRVHNYKKMEKRRASFSFGVEYNTSAEKIRKIPAIIKNIISQKESVELNRVHFKKFGDFSLDFEVVYYLMNSEYGKYMDVQEEINLAIIEEFEKEKIVFAYPTQTIYFNKKI